MSDNTDNVTPITAAKHDSSKEFREALSDFQSRLFASKAQLHGADAVARELSKEDDSDDRAIDVYEILQVVTAEIEQIADEIGNRC
jgi:hypothetical protein